MSSYREAVSTLHVALENGSDLHVNERQKIRHYRGSPLENKNKKNKNKKNRKNILKMNKEVGMLLPEKC